MNNLHLIIERLDRIEKKLNGNYTDPYLSIKEVSEFCSLSQSTIRRAVDRGQLKEIRLCTVIDCAIYPYRMGTRPNEETIKTLEKFRSKKPDPARDN